MTSFHIEQSLNLQGSIDVSGAKNAILPIMYASLLTRGNTALYNVPDIADVRSTILILRSLGARVIFDSNKLFISNFPDKLTPSNIPIHMIKSTRASVCLLGALASHCKRFIIATPGGCFIGQRPIDLHIKALGKLGIDVNQDDDFIYVRDSDLQGADIDLCGPHGSTVLGTINAILAATLANGTTNISNAACEPEIANLCDYLNRCGARIYGAGSTQITINGVSSLIGVEHLIMPDRAEAGTLMLMALGTNSEIQLNRVCVSHLDIVIDTLKKIGASIRVINERSLIIKGTEDIGSLNMSALPYPGFPTDLQPQLTSVLCKADKVSMVEDFVYPVRFMHVLPLNSFGANIEQHQNKIIINPVKRLHGAKVRALDLRTGASLLIAALMADSNTHISNIFYIERGYEHIDKKLQSLGAKIKRM